MKPKIAEKVPTEDWKLFDQVKELISSLPAELDGPVYLMGIRMPRDFAVGHFIPDCHAITRALAKFLPVDVHDGFVLEARMGEKGKRHVHSWLTRKGTDGMAIIDPWPLGVVSGPALFIQDYAFHFGPESIPLHVKKRAFKRQVAIIRSAMREHLISLKAAA